MKLSPLALALVLLAPVTVFAQISVSISVAPPELPVYEQPALPGDGYIWTPGYWAYGDDDYYWVPGTWVQPPQPGFLWTPGYWGWNAGIYSFNAGYWGTHVGYYGGINYGYGYGGEGYGGGRWDNGHFDYNRTVNNVSTVNIRNSYSETVISNSSQHTSFNGGTGTQNHPTAADEVAAHEKHVTATAEQTRHEQGARAQPELRQSANHGKPPIGATPRAAAFENHGGAAEAKKPLVEPQQAAQAAHPKPAAHPRPKAVTQAKPAQQRAEPQAAQEHAQPAQEHAQAAQPHAQAAQEHPMQPPHAEAAKPQPQAHPQQEAAGQKHEEGGERKEH